LLTFSGTLLAAFAIVRERERGTLEQLMVTPASPVAVVLGKLLPYLVLAFAQLLFILLLMVAVFRVPIYGNLFMFLGLSIVYLFALLALGLVVSSRARAPRWRRQVAQMFLLPRSCSRATSSAVFAAFAARVFAGSSGHASSRSRADHHSRATSGPLCAAWRPLLIIAVLLVAGSTERFRNDQLECKC
jgi:ABC-type Na+ efflux pump permease subunit